MNKGNLEKWTDIPRCTIVNAIIKVDQYFAVEVEVCVIFML